MICNRVLENISSTLIQVTGCNQVFGGVNFILFGDVGQLLPVQREEGYIWKSAIYTDYCSIFKLTSSIRQQSDVVFQDILSNVCEGIFDDALVRFLPLVLCTRVNFLTARSVYMYQDVKQEKILTE